MNSFWGYKGYTGLILFIMVHTIIIAPFIIVPILNKISKTLQHIEKRLSNKENTHD